MCQETYLLELLNIGSLPIVIERKKVSSCRLKVYPSQKIKLSVPSETSSEWIDNFLQNKKDWITKKLEVFTKTKGYETTNIIHNGMSIRMLGRDMIFYIKKSIKKSVSVKDRTICIEVSDTSNEQEIMRLFEVWWRKQAFEVYEESIKKLYPIIKKHDINKPVLLIKKMKTLWGSSSPHKGTITINQYLLKAKRACIEYVILHEIIHFLILRHNQKFYDLLTLYMPDWKERKKTLDTEVVQGLLGY